MLKIRHPGRWKTSDGELVHRKMDPISRGGQGAKRLWTESVRNAEHFETMPDVNKVKFVWWRCAQGQHPFSSRTRRLRPVRPMVLYWRRYGRAGGCQTYLINRRRAQRKMCFARARRGQDRQVDLESDRISDERAGARVPGP